MTNNRGPDAWHDISLRGPIYDKWRSYCMELGEPIRKITDDIVRNKLDELGFQMSEDSAKPNADDKVVIEEKTEEPEKKSENEPDKNQEEAKEEVKEEFPNQYQIF